MKNGGYLNNVTGIASPHVFHIKMCRELGGAGILTKGLWSTSTVSDPWTSVPFMLLREPLAYTRTPECEMRSPPPDKVEDMKKGLLVFKKVVPTEEASLKELQECVLELEESSRGAHEFAWNLEDGINPTYVVSSQLQRPRFGVSNRILLPHCHDSEPNSDEEEPYDSDGLYDDSWVDKECENRTACSPILLGKPPVGLTTSRKKVTVTPIGVGEYVCVKTYGYDKLPFYVGRVRSVFQYTSVPQRWTSAVNQDPDLKFLEVHWWQMKGEEIERGYSQRLYEAVRLNKELASVDHIDVIREDSVMYSFPDLTSKIMKGGRVTSGKLGKRVLVAVQNIIRSNQESGTALFPY